MKRARIKTRQQLKSKTAAKQVEVFPKGVIIHPGSQRPVLLFKSADERHVLPVWLNPLDAGLSLQVLGSRDAISPHTPGLAILQKLKLKRVDCHFNKITGHHQFVNISARLDGDQLDSENADVNVQAGAKSQTEAIELTLRADAAMSFCLAAQAKFTADLEVIQASRILNEEIDEFSEGLRSGLLLQNFSDADHPSKKTGYLM